VKSRIQKIDMKGEGLLLRRIKGPRGGERGEKRRGEYENVCYIHG
jgi:hypothetical protein